MDDDTSIELETIPSANIAQETDNPPKIFVFVKSDGVEEFKVQNETSAFDFRDQYCEDAIKIICKELKFTPKTFLNFGLISRKSKVWLPSYQKLTNASAYEFRLRFHVNM